MAATNDRKEILRRTTHEEIEKAYTAGRIDYAQRKQMLRDKALLSNADAFGEQGYMHALYKKTLKEIQKGWDNIYEGATDVERSGMPVNILNEMYGMGLVAWGGIQILNSIPTAAGEILGLEAERIALQNGADPTLARYIGIVADLGSNFLPAGAIAGATVKGIKGVQKAIGAEKKVEQLGLKLSGAGGTSGTGIKDAMKGAQSQQELALGAESAVVRPAKDTALVRQVIEEALDTSLKAGGAEKTIFKVATPATPAAKVATAPKAPSVTPVPVPHAKRTQDFAREGDRVVTPSGKVVDRTTGEIIEGPIAAGEEAMVGAGGIGRVRVSRVHSANKVAEEKLGIPQSEMQHVLTAWAPEAVAAGDMERAASVFLADMDRVPPGKVDAVRRIMQNVLSESGSMRGMGLTPEQFASGWDKGVELFRNVLLSGPAGRTRDAISNMVSTGVHLAQRTAGGMLGRSVTDVAKGQPFTESYYYGKGMSLAWRDGLDSFLSAFGKEGLETAAHGGSRFDAPIVRKIGGTWGDIVNTPTSVTIGIDRAMKTLHRRGALYAMELEEAHKVGRAFDIRNVDFPDSANFEKATQLSEYLTFQNELGTLGKKILNVQKHGPIELFFPFMKTPINLGKYSWNNTPGLQVLSKRLYDEIKTGGEAADLALGRLTMSNMMAFFISDLVKEELITGSGPGNPAQKAAWEKTHKPYSIRIEDQWIPLNFLGPLAHSIGMIADYTMMMGELTEAEIGQGGQAIMLAIHENLGQNSWFSSLKNLIDAVSVKGKQDTGLQQSAKVIMSPAVSMVTGGSLVREVKDIVDPVSRETRTWLDQVKARTPVWSETLPMKRNEFGHPIVPPHAVGGRWTGVVNPIKATPVEIDDKAQRYYTEASRLQVHFPRRGNSIGGPTYQGTLAQPREGDRIGVPLSEWQEDDRDIIYGNFLDHPETGLNAMMDSLEYRNAPDVVKRQYFEGMMQDALKFANEMVKDKHPSLRVKEMELNAKRHLPTLGVGAERDEAEEDFAAMRRDYLDELDDNEMNNVLKYSTFD